MIKVKKPKKKIKPHYILRISYMIGDANGDTTEEMEVKPDEPNLEKFVKIMNKLKNLTGTWGIVLDYEYLEKALKQKIITKKEHDFLEEAFEEYGDIIRSDTEYSFLVYQGIELLYIDEYGNENETEFV